MLSGATPRLNKVPDGNVSIRKQIDASLDRILLLLVLRDNSTLTDSASPTSEWSPFCSLLKEKEVML